jgi:hypothetical protein
MGTLSRSQISFVPPRQADPAYLSRMLKDAFGVTPARYRTLEISATASRG